MTLHPRLASAFAVRPEETRLVAALLGASAFVGVARVFAEAAANTLFLVQVGAAALPYLYLGMAVVTPLAGWLYAHLTERLSFERLLLITFGGLAAGLLALRLAFSLTAGRWPAVALALGFDVLYVFTSIAFWGLAGRVFDVRQGKRLFGLIGAGEVGAAILGGLFIPALVGRLGTANLLLLSAGGLAGALLLLSRAARGAREAAETAQPVSAAAGPAPPLLRSPYVRLLIVFFSVSLLQTYFLDNAFYTGLEAQYPAEERLAGFVGLFLAAAGVLTLLSRAFLSGRVLSRYGAQAGLVLLAALLTAGSAAAALSGAFLGAGALLFWLIAATKLADKVLGNSLYQASCLVLYQPLPAGQRLRVQAVIESIVEPLAIGATGLLLLGLRALWPFTLVHQVYALLLILAALILVTVRLGRQYRAMLVQALARRKISGTALQVADAASLAALRRGLESPHAGVVLYSMHTLAEAEPAALAEVLPGLLAHAAPEVRAEALGLIERLNLAEAHAALRRSAFEEPEPHVRGLALRALAASADEDAVELVAPSLDDPQPAVRLGAMTGLLRSGGIEGVLAAGERLIEAVRSPDPAERALAARALGAVGVAGFYRPLLSLLEDEDHGVRRAALVAAGRVRNPRLWPLVAEALKAPAVRAEAAGALVQGGEEALPQLEALFARPDSSPDVLAHAARVCGRIGGERALDLLRANLAHPAGRVRSAVLDALLHGGYRAAETEAALVQARLRAEAEAAAGLLRALADLPESGPAGANGAERAAQGAFLAEALRVELRRARLRLLHLLAFLYDPRAVGHARDNLASASAEKRAYALEVLDLLLPPETKAMLFPVLEDLPPGEALGRLPAGLAPPRASAAARLRALALGEAGSTPWVQACALWALAERGAEARPVLAEALAAPEPLARETAAWALARLDGPPEGEKTMLSTIEKVLILKAVGLFADTPNDVLAEVAGLLEEEEFGEGEAIVRKGETGRCLYIVADGRVRVHDGERTLNDLGEGAVFGELAVLDAEPRSASVTAAEETRLFRLDQEPLYELMSDRAEVARGIIRVLAANLRARVSDVSELHARLEAVGGEK